MAVATPYAAMKKVKARLESEVGQMSPKPTVVEVTAVTPAYGARWQTGVSVTLGAAL